MKKIVTLLLALAAVFSAPPAFADHDYRNGIARYQKRDFRGATASLQAYIGRTPDPRAYYLIGYAQYKLKNFPEARKYFSEAYLLDPKFDPSSILRQGK